MVFCLRNPSNDQTIIIFLPFNTKPLPINNEFSSAPGRAVNNTGKKYIAQAKTIASLLMFCIFFAIVIIHLYGITFRHYLITGAVCAKLCDIKSRLEQKF